MQRRALRVRTHLAAQMKLEMAQDRREVKILS
jgi:hypothetical protein